MSSNAAANVRLSFSEFASHGGGRGPHADGWGIAYYEGRDARVMREPSPAAHSPCARLIADNDMESNLVVSHIRRATRGAISLANTQPFVREVTGRLHLFAHNGDLPDLDTIPLEHSHECYQPIGQTDSEHAFCLLLQRVKGLWANSDAVPALELRLKLVSAFARELRALGPANFIYTDSDTVFAHGHRRHNGDGIRPPGLWTLTRRCRVPRRTDTDGLSIASTTAQQEVALVASVPLSDEERWTPMEEGEVVALRDGVILARTRP